MALITLDELQARGFDLSRSTRRGGLHSYRVACSGCEAAVINGTPCHEHGCPNKRDACRECGSPCERGARYCSPCCAAAHTGASCDCDTCRELNEPEGD